MAMLSEKYRGKPLDVTVLVICQSTNLEGLLEATEQFPHVVYRSVPKDIILTQSLRIPAYD